MAALTNLQMMALECPQLGTPPLLVNGVYFNAYSDFFQGLLDTNGGVVELALAQLFRILSNEDRSATIRLGEFEFSKRVNMTFDQRRQYWEQKYRAIMAGGANVAPTIGSSGMWGQPYPPPPAVR